MNSTPTQRPSREIEMANRQHAGPVGRYVVPKEHRFSWNPETYKMTSLVKEIQVLEEQYGAREAYYEARLRVGKNIYAVRALRELELDIRGEQVNYTDTGKKDSSGRVWSEVALDIITDDKKSGLEKRSKVSILSISDFIPSLALEFLSVPRETKISFGLISRIIFNEKEKITPKNYKVVHND